MIRTLTTLFVLINFLLVLPVAGQESVVNVWPGDPPAWEAPEGAEADTTGPDGRQVAGRDVIRLGNVSTPQLYLYPAKDSETTVVICPGGGYSILAWDLEGTEIAEWFQKHGVSAAVLKYRVPTRNQSPRWKAPVQDIQRSVSMIRSGVFESLPSEHVGVLGFSAGGNATAHAATATERLYDAIDERDEASPVPDFAALIYAAYLNEGGKESMELADGLTVSKDTPPMFFAHAFDDRINCLGPIALFSKLKQNGIASALHVFSTGGHGFGGRDTGEAKDAWLSLCLAWMKDQQWVD
ncbi:alpha/beta hydrolase [Roseiconus nitratireducens]|uniref:Alpha/beta hydrolase n=1 Tax=Roseiconus nitratireducens TaxID=2605748 RepID=A0A5M6D8H1_9BACT|nr:alpha/beta hydrolase [Roseiconus nitratireducens]KAA5541475.1 alpha/beta hydrolase [Roseiconus nitratireducens]